MNNEWKINREVNGGIEGWVALYKVSPMCPFAYVHEDEAEEIVSMLREKSELERIGAAVNSIAPFDLAIRFHEIYERLSSSFGYETRKATRCFEPDSPNGRLMIATCREILTYLASRKGEK